MSTLAVFLPLYVLLAIHGSFEVTHDIPNPFWATLNRSFTYTPEQGPPPGLFRSRPDEIERQYLTDYIRVAGTYPCIENLDAYDPSQDPVLQGKSCDVTRPVDSFSVASVKIAPPDCDCGFADATLRFHVTYADGLTHNYVTYMSPAQFDTYWLSEAKMDCWSSLDTLLFYPKIVSQAPAGAQYGLSADFRCQPADT